LILIVSSGRNLSLLKVFIIFFLRVLSSNRLSGLSVNRFIKPGTDPGRELVFKRHFMNCKHWGELIDERHFKEAAKLWLIFLNSKVNERKVIISLKYCNFGQTFSLNV